jgi:hypothetical protein
MELELYNSVWANLANESAKGEMGQFLIDAQHELEAWDAHMAHLRVELAARAAVSRALLGQSQAQMAASRATVAESQELLAHMPADRWGLSQVSPPKPHEFQ